MDKMKMESVDMTTRNIEKIAEMFPNCVTEMLDEKESSSEKKIYKKAINFEMLKQMLSSDILDGDEAYEFTWVGKKAAIVDANKSIRKTLRPCKGKSEKWDTTENLYIEGDNLEVLKLLQESYLGVVKMIYIDPPYNTGNDFIYQDDFTISSKEYDEEQGVYEEDGNRLFKNSDTNGRFHSMWCSMMYSRLMLARNLLSEDGAIFISIDDNEVNNLKKICDEIFGESNFVSQLTIIVKPEGRRYGAFAKSHDYMLVYAKNIITLSLNEIEIEGTEHKYTDSKGGFNLKGLRNRNVQAFNSTNRPNLRYPFYVDVNNPDSNGLFAVSTEENPGLEKVEASIIGGLESVWRWGKEKATNQKDDLVGYRGNDNIIRIFQKERKLSQTPKTVWAETEIISNKGTKELQELMGKGVFDFPKPVELLKKVVEIGSDPDSIVMDFFSGSGTIAHSVMLKNAEDGGNRKFIAIQLPEECENDSPAYKEGFNTICDIGIERIKRASKKIISDYNAVDIDTGFRVFKLSNSNFKDVYYSASDYTQGMLDLLESNIEDDRTDLDLLFGCLLEWGLPLTLNYSEQKMGMYTIHNYNDGDLIACFDMDISEDVIRKIAQLQPLRVIFRDECFKGSPQKINVTEIFKLIAPNTRVKVI